MPAMSCSRAVTPDPGDLRTSLDHYPEEQAPKVELEPELELDLVLETQRQRLLHRSIASKSKIVTSKIFIISKNVLWISLNF